MHPNDQKARFALAVLHRTLQHFDTGGAVNTLPVPSNLAPGTTLGAPSSPTWNSASNPNTGIAGTIGGALGLTNNFQAGAANIQAGTNNAQLNNAYAQSQNALAQQQALANQFTPGGMEATQSQQQLLEQLQQQAQGGGPNPAQAMLNQNTAANTANQAALMAGQRGASSNVGLIARQAAQQGALNQQNAVGQGAALQAQQQLAAQRELQAQQAQLVGQQSGAVQGVNNAGQNEQQILQNANTAFNNAGVGMQSNINSTNAQTAAGNQGMVGSLLGGIAGGAGAALSGIAAMFAEGGEVPRKYAAGGVAGSVPGVQLPLSDLTGSGNGPKSMAGQWFNSGGANSNGPNIAQPLAGPSQDFSAMQKNITAGLNSLAPTEAPTTTGTATDWSLGGGMAGGPGDVGGPKPSFDVSNMAAKGGRIGGKAKVKGDSYSNDTVPAMLSPGEVVIPRHVMNSKDPVAGAAKFVQAVLAKKQGLRRAA